MGVPLELSVIVATRDRKALLGRCIESLSRQSQDPATFEMVVADDGSMDGTDGMIDRLETPFRLRRLDLGRVGRAAARNAGIESSAGAVCLILDDDVVADPDLVAEHLAAHRRDGLVMGIGRITQELPRRRDWYARAFARAWNRHYEGLAEKEPDWTAAYGGNLSAPRASLLDVGGFATPELPVGQDIELAYRLWRAGCVPAYLPRAHGVHDDQKPRRKLLEDSGLQGEAAVELAERQPAMLPKLLGWFGATTPREIVLRRIMLVLRIPPSLLASLGPIVPGSGRQVLWFDFVRRYAFWRGVRRQVHRGRWMQITRGVPVLMYHAFSAGRSPGRYTVSRRSFGRQMRLLAVLRYRVVPFEEIAQALRESRLPPRRAVAVTIDDGYADNAEVARPILRRHRFPATVFVVSERIGGRNDWTDEPSLDGLPLLSREQLLELRDEGMRLGAHTRTHASLPEADDERVRWEVGGSREDLEGLAQANVKVFAYPFGRFDDRAVEAVEEARFTGAGTTEPRLARPDENPSLIPRIEVKGDDSVPRFLRKLWFGGP